MLSLHAFNIWLHDNIPRKSITVTNNTGMPNIAIPAETPVIKSWRRHITASINAIKNAIALYALNVTKC